MTWLMWHTHFKCKCFYPGIVLVNYVSIYVYFISGIDYLLRSRQLLRFNSLSSTFLMSLQRLETILLPPLTLFWCTQKQKNYKMNLSDEFRIMYLRISMLCLLVFVQLVVLYILKNMNSPRISVNETHEIFFDLVAFTFELFHSIEIGYDNDCVHPAIH